MTSYKNTSKKTFTYVVYTIYTFYNVKNTRQLEPVININLRISLNDLIEQIYSNLLKVYFYLEPKILKKRKIITPEDILKELKIKILKQEKDLILLLVYTYLFFYLCQKYPNLGVNKILELLNVCLSKLKNQLELKEEYTYDLKILNSKKLLSLKISIVNILIHIFKFFNFIALEISDKANKVYSFNILSKRYLEKFILFFFWLSICFTYYLCK